MLYTEKNAPKVNNLNYQVQFEEFNFNVHHPQLEEEQPVVQLLDNTTVTKLDDKNFLYRPADIKSFDDWILPKNHTNYFIPTDMFEMFNGLPIPIQKKRKMSDTSNDSIIKLFE